MPRTRALEFPFVDGQHEEIDSKLLPDGYLTRAKNVRLRKDGRFGVRPDFDAVDVTTMLLVNTFAAQDLIGSDDRLLALGNEANVASPPQTLYDYVDAQTAAWHRLPESSKAQRLGVATALRDMGRPPSQTNGAGDVDVAAAGGLACMIYTSGSDLRVHVFEAATDQTLYFGALLNIAKAHVIAVGTVFWIVGVSSAAASVDLWRFDPATDEAPVAGANVSSGININTFDAALNHAGNGLWVAVHRGTVPSTKIYPVTSAGVVGTAVTGPATAFGLVSVAETSNRLMLGVVNSPSGTVAAYSYASGTLSAGPTTVFGASTTGGIVGLLPVGANMYFYVSDGTGATLDLLFRSVNGVSHTLAALSTIKDAPFTTKPFTVPTFGFGDQDALQAVGICKSEGSSKSNALLMTSSQILAAYKDRFAALSGGDILPQIAFDASTGKYYWPMILDDGDGRSVPVITEFEYALGARRQTADLAGHTYIAGGAPAVWDGRQLVDAGFAERSRIISATPGSGGALPSSAVLLVAVVWEWRDAKGDLHQSFEAEPVTVTMGGSDTAITVVASAPHSLRKNSSSDATASTVTAIAYRSISGVNQLRRAELALAADFGSPVTIVLRVDDDTVRANGVIYTQAARGALSGTLPHEAPLPFEYVWPFGARLLSAGGPNPYVAQVSKELFPGEPVTWSGAAGFLLPAVPERIRGVASLDQRGLLFTSESIFQFSGDGPNDNGENGYAEPTRVPGSTGLRTWQSLVETPIGLFFQGSNGHLWVLPRDGSPPAWIGQPVRDTLDAFPVVTSATLLAATQLVSFTCCNTGLTDARVVSYDLRVKTWIVDEFATPTPIAAATHYQGRLAYGSSGVVWLERASFAPNSFLEHGVTTGDVKSAGGTGWQKLSSYELVGEYRDDCNLRARISYDAGKSFTTQSKIFQLRAAQYAPGDIVRCAWTPARAKCERFRIEFAAITAGRASEGFVFNSWGVELLGAKGPSRKAASQRG